MKKTGFKKIVIVIMAILAVSLFFLLRKPWLNSNQEAVDYLNSHYSFDAGRITEFTYLEKGRSQETGDYLKYLVTFENGNRSIMNVYVKMHKHLNMIGPDFRVNSCRVFDRDIVMQAGRYVQVHQADGKLVISINENRTYELKGHSDKTMTGKWRLEDNVLVLADSDGNDLMKFITDGSVLAYQKADGRNWNINDDEIFILD